MQKFLGMSLLEITSRANFLIYNYIQKTLRDNTLAEIFRKGAETACHNNLVIFKGLEDLTVILQKYYSYQVNSVVNSSNSCSEGEKTAAVICQPDSNGKCKEEKKKKKRQSKQSEGENLEQANPVPEVDPVTVKGGDMVYQQVPVESDYSQAEKKRKRKRYLEIESEGGEQRLKKKEAPMESNNGSIAIMGAEGGHDAPKKRRRKHQAEISGDELPPATNHGREAAVAMGSAETEDGSKKKRKKQKSITEAVPRNADEAAEVFVDVKTEETQQWDEDAGGNGNADGEDKKSLKRPKRHNQPFRRVREEEVINKHFHDNSFDAKPGACNGWGYKANEDLKPTQGRSFRHEKTKKKRGSYKGGVIDTGVSSFKFESDSE